MNRNLLEKPFNEAQIKQREGTYGNVLDYVEGHTVIQRLNDAFDANWSFEILRHEILEEKDEVLVLGKLTADQVVKTQFGSSRITRDDAGQIASIASDLKAAGTDALKKCATLLGVGLHLYGNGNGSGGRRSYSDHSQRGHNSHGNGTNGGNNGGSSRSNGNGRITNKQLNYAVNLGRNLGLNSRDLDEECLKSFGVKMAYLSIKDASSFIDSLKQKAA